MANSSKECYGVGLTQCSSIKSVKKAWGNHKVSYWSDKKYSNFSSSSNLEIPFSFPVISLKNVTCYIYILGKTRRLPLYLMVYIQGYFVFNKATFKHIPNPPKRKRRGLGSRQWKTMEIFFSQKRSTFNPELIIFICPWRHTFSANWGESCHSCKL